MKHSNDLYARADMTLRGALMWAGVGDWGSPHSLIYAAEGAAKKIRDLEREVRTLQERVSKAETGSE